MIKSRKSRAHSRLVSSHSGNVIAETELWRPYSKRISKRSKEDSTQEDEDDDHSDKKDISNWAEEFFGRKSASDDVDQDVEVNLTPKQTLVLSTLVPDEILYWGNFDDIEPKRFVGVLMMADVSGYTALSERYNNTGKGGTYRLTVTLNTYLGALIELIYSYGGDVIKFAGDAFLALWKTDKKTFLNHTIHTVIACALVIQHSYSNYETDVKVNLKVKLAISAGNLLFAPIGSGIDMNYVIFGLPVIEAKLAESVCNSGEVKVTPTAWAHCYSRNYDYVLHEDGHVTIKTILYDPRESIVKPFIGISNMVRATKPSYYTYCTIENLPDYYWEGNKLNTSDELRKENALKLRKAAFMANNKQIGGEIRKFMIRPVLTQIDAHQPLEFLTEMRLVSILFVTLKPTNCSPAQLITIVNNSYQIICEIVYKSMGCVNKIILFDKDVMALVIFGLRGFKHESEAQAALKCAYSIKKSVSALDGVLEVSIGVTTGQVYCGVIGHPLRREFTVIGAIVNKAARLMCNFRNKISCDETTFIKSKMSKNGFSLLPKTELKGIVHPGNMYEYTEEIRAKEINNIPLTPPLLDRSDEMEYLENWLDMTHVSYRDFDALLIIGESRIGKSRLLEWMARQAKIKGFNVCLISLTSIHSSSPYLGLVQIVNQMLGITEPTLGFQKEEKIIELLKVYDEDLCYLNNIIKVRFAYHEAASALNEDQRKQKAKQIFLKLMLSVPDVYVICLDDLHNLDSNSWEFIALMFQIKKVFTILSVTRGKFSTVHKWLYNVFTNDSIRKIVLGPLSSGWIAPLACQILDVDAVPHDLCNALRINCKGMPGLVECFIVHLFSTGAIEMSKIKGDDLNQYQDEDLQFPDPKLLRAQALNAKDQEVLDDFMDRVATDEIRICLVKRKEELKVNFNIQNIDAVLLVQIDVLTPYQQLLLKIASVIGNVLSRNLLENIMYENDSLVTARAIKRLFSMRIFMCANTANKRNLSLGSSIYGLNTHTDFSNLVCDCDFQYDAEGSESLPKYAFCKVMKFRSKISRKTCYELLPINQKKEFHSRIVNYLENSDQKCPDCGGVIMVLQSVMNLPCNLDSSDTALVKEPSNSESSESSQENAPSTTRSANQPKQTASESFDRANINDNATISIDRPSKSEYTYNHADFTPILKKTTEDDIFSTTRMKRRVTMHALPLADLGEDSNEELIYSKFRAVLEANTNEEWSELGASDSRDNVNGSKESDKKLFTINIKKGVSQTNFNKCTCTDLNLIIYEQLIHHATQAEMLKKALEFQVHYAYLNLLSNNIETALETLEESEDTCYDKNIIGKIFTPDEKQRVIGKIHSLKSFAYLLSGKLLAAKMEMERAIGVYTAGIPKLFSIRHIIKRRQKAYIERRNALKSDSVFCYNVATLLYWSLDDEKSSKMYALRTLRLIQEVQCRIVDICDALTNSLRMDVERGNPEGSQETERIAKQVIRNFPRPLEADELYGIGKLCMATFHARLARGELSNAIRSGFRAISLSKFLQAHSITLSLIPDLFYGLLARRRIQDAIDIVQLTMMLGQSQEMYTCETWYYALCMDLILDAGVQLESPADIHRYSEYTLFRHNQEGPSRRRLIVNLWTYFLRIDTDRKAKRLEDEVLAGLGRNDDDASMANLMTSLRLAEGLLESLARKVDDLRKVVDMVELRSIADKELTKLEKNCRLNRVCLPRWLLLKAFSLKLSSRFNAANTTLSQALDESRKVFNHLEASLHRAAVSNSTNWLQNARTAGFPFWREGLQDVQSSWHSMMYRITTRL